MNEVDDFDLIKWENSANEDRGGGVGFLVMKPNRLYSIMFKQNLGLMPNLT